MKARNSGYSSDTEQKHIQDLSVLRKPIFSTLSGFLEAKKAYEKGTEEVKKLLTRECEIIYECKVCKNIFRSLTNFISHKRVYCRNTFSYVIHNFNANNDGFIDQDISTIIQAEQEFVKTTKPKFKTNQNTGKDLSSIIERLLEREQNNRLMKLTDFYDQVNNKLTQDEVLKKNHCLQLDRVPNSDIAVYQTVKLEDNDNIKNEVKEVDDLLLNDVIILGPDGKISTENIQENDLFYPLSELIKNEIEASTDILQCEICDMTFVTEKTLILHIQAKHIDSTLWYRCPSCDRKYLTQKSVIRHLTNIHKKSVRRIRILRDSISKKKIRADEIQTKGPNRELIRLQRDNDKLNNENSWNMDENNSKAPACPHCGKSFERKAVLTTHMNNCSIKTKTNNLNKKSTNESIITNDKTNKSDTTIKQLSSNSDKNCIDLTKPDYLIKKRKRKQSAKVYIKNDEQDSGFFNDNCWNTNVSLENLDSIKIDSIDDLNRTDDSSSPILKQELETKQNARVCVYFCKICQKRFDAISNLRRHISMFHYRQRKFGCKMCEFRAFRKCDVIFHLNQSHSVSGDKEVLLSYVIVHEVDKVGNSDINIDLEYSETGTATDESLSNNKNCEHRRPKKIKPNKVAKIPIPKKIKFTRSSSNLSLSSNEDLNTIKSKRPIRNRVKTVQKDFVYDLSNLLKKDMVLSESDTSTVLVPAKSQKKRYQAQIAEEVTVHENFKAIIPANTIEKPIPENIKGSAIIMARMAVATYKACFCQPPELPNERPMIPCRTASSTKSEPIDDSNLTNGEIIINSNNEKDNSSIVEESFFSILCKKRKLDTIKPLENNLTISSQTKSVIHAHENGFKNNKTNNTNENNIIFNESLTEKHCVEIQKFTDIEIKSKVSTTKRVSLMERLIENKRKRLQDGLLKSALEK